MMLLTKPAHILNHLITTLYWQHVWSTLMTLLLKTAASTAFFSQIVGIKKIMIAAILNLFAVEEPATLGGELIYVFVVVERVEI